MVLSKEMLILPFSQRLPQMHGSFIALLVYVDDIIVAGDNMPLISKLKALLDTKFRIKDLGELNYFLGIEVVRNADGMNICQRKYALDILQETSFMDSKPVHSPMVTGLKLIPNDGIPLSDAGIYGRLVGRLLYLTVTRLDIYFAV